MSKKLEGKVAVITRGNSGIGLATARRYVAEDVHVFLTGRRQAELDEGVRQIGKHVTGVPDDVSNLADLNRLFTTVKRQHSQKAAAVFPSVLNTPRPRREVGGGPVPPQLGRVQGPLEARPSPLKLVGGLIAAIGAFWVTKKDQTHQPPTPSSNRCSLLISGWNFRRQAGYRISLTLRVPSTSSNGTVRKVRVR